MSAEADSPLLALLRPLFAVLDDLLTRVDQIESRLAVKNTMRTEGGCLKPSHDYDATGACTRCDARRGTRGSQKGEMRWAGEKQRR